MSLIGSIDQGTQSTRFTLFDSNLNIVKFADASHEQIFLEPGWCEHDPSELLDKTISLMNQVFTDYKQTCEEGNQSLIKTLSGIGITNQRETVLVWDKATGKPLSNAIVWLDIRTSKIAERYTLENKGEDAFKNITGSPINTYFSGFKIKWLMENNEQVANGLRDKTAIIGNINTWLIWNLTGGVNGGKFLTDVTNASRMFLMDINTLKWSPTLLSIFDLSIDSLPEILSCSDDFGSIAHPLLPDYNGVSICGCVGDQQAACIGQGLFSPGKVKCTYGTGAFIMMNTGTPNPILSTHGLLTTPCYQFKGQPVVWSLEGAISVAGAGVSWMRDKLGLIETAAETETLAKTVADSDGVVFVPAFGGLFAPYWASHARASLYGLTLLHTKAHIARALLESIAFLLNDILLAMAKDMGLQTGVPLVRADGGMVVNSTFCQINADLVNCIIESPSDVQVTSIGAAIAAGFGSKVFTSIEEVERILANKVGSTWKPKMDSLLREKKKKQWKLAVEKSMNWESVL